MIDLVGNAADHAARLRLPAKGGKLVIVGLFGGGATWALPLIPIKAVTIQGSYVGNLRETQELLDLVRTKKIAPIPVTTMPLVQSQRSAERSAQGQAGRPRGADAVDIPPSLPGRVPKANPRLSCDSRKSAMLRDQPAE